MVLEMGSNFMSNAYLLKNRKSIYAKTKFLPHLQGSITFYSILPKTFPINMDMYVLFL